MLNKTATIGTMHFYTVFYAWKHLFKHLPVSCFNHFCDESFKVGKRGWILTEYIVFNHAPQKNHSVSDHSFVEATNLLRWLDFQKNFVIWSGMSPLYMLVCHPVGTMHPFHWFQAKQWSPEQVVDTTPPLWSQKKKNGPMTHWWETTRQTSSFWGCSPWLSVDHNRKFCYFTYSSKSTHPSSVKNVVPR